MNSDENFDKEEAEKISNFIQSCTGELEMMFNVMNLYQITYGGIDQDTLEVFAKAYAASVLYRYIKGGTAKDLAEHLFQKVGKVGETE